MDSHEHYIVFVPGIFSNPLHCERAFNRQDHSSNQYHTKGVKELQFEYKTVKAELMRRSRAVEIENEVAPFGLVVAKEMPIRLVLEKRIPSANNNLKEDSK